MPEQITLSETEFKEIIKEATKAAATEAIRLCLKEQRDIVAFIDQMRNGGKLPAHSYETVLVLAVRRVPRAFIEGFVLSSLELTNIQ